MGLGPRRFAHFLRFAAFAPSSAWPLGLSAVEVTAVDRTRLSVRPGAFPGFGANAPREADLPCLPERPDDFRVVWW
jgi:hypothetical protein